MSGGKGGERCEGGRSHGRFCFCRGRQADIIKEVILFLNFCIMECVSCSTRGYAKDDLALEYVDSK